MVEGNFSFANLGNLLLMEELYGKYLQDPTSVDPSWRYFFEGMQFNALARPASNGESPDLKVYLLINAYRKFGHLIAKSNPLALGAAEKPNELRIETWGFQAEDLKKAFPTCGFLPKQEALLEELVTALQQTYCQSIGVEYMDLQAPELEKWLQAQIEPGFPLHLSADDKRWILHLLNKAELFEMFIHTRYVGQKRFSIEGAETMIPMLAALIERGAEHGVEEAMLGMAHRGRLNVLTNILSKSYGYIFHEFEDHFIPNAMEGTGDVKYHKGFTGHLTTRKQQSVIVELAANPSHLESVDGVIEGMARARQTLKAGRTAAILPILIHGDAALAGEGIIYETMQLSGLKGYSTGGTIHLVINNQIGFTTVPKDARSTLYCTEIARSFGAPVFHVNAEDPEACVRVAYLATEIRQKFARDVFIDLYGYRKYGHNEGDEPMFTQPIEYTLIKNKRSIRELFKDRLIQERVLDLPGAERIEEEFKSALHQALESVPQILAERQAAQPLKTSEPVALQTSLDASALQTLARACCAIPETFKAHPKIKRLYQERLAMVQADPAKPSVDWGMGETLAYASLLSEGIHVRISGQDVRRGTFSHRHAMLVDQVSGQKYFPLSHISQTQAPFDIFNSPLSEFGVLGFEFGYSLAYPNSLVIWEAQFGDFANTGQVIIDQYIATSEQKWNQATNFTLLLPHGYEGQGPEHSSARIERFLQLCGHDNMRVVNCSTPSQLFHILRLQAKSPVRKPLILFTPKAILRHPGCVSAPNDFVQSAFQPVLDDPVQSQNIQRLLLCSGKIYYDLMLEREKRSLQDTAILRVEQLYPFPKETLAPLLKKYAAAAKIAWVQEEHSNMGAWEYIRPRLEEMLGAKNLLEYIGRDRSASPATGSHTMHKKQLEEIINLTFNK